jgi:predicted deacylase
MDYLARHARSWKLNKRSEFRLIHAARPWHAERASSPPRDRRTGTVPPRVPGQAAPNLSSFRARSPFVIPEDGKNLNWCFPGDPAGTLTERLAHSALTELIAGADLVIDAHAGDLPEALEPFAMYDAGPAEAGGCEMIDDHAVWLHLRGLDRVLAALGMTDDPAPWLAGEVAQPARLSRFLWLRSAADGWWQPVVRPGEVVAQGQLLGTVSTIDGARTVQSVTARPTAY